MHRRRSVRKGKSVKSFKQRSAKTHKKNNASPLRGGWRL